MKGSLLSECCPGFRQAPENTHQHRFLLPAPLQPTHPPLRALFSKAVPGTRITTAGTMNAGLMLVCFGGIGVKSWYFIFIYLFIDIQLIYRSRYFLNN